MWALSFDKTPDPFTRADFVEETPTVTVYGNLADADQGKDEGDAVLGNGDARQIFQTFKVPKVPLTYHISAGATPPQVPELEVYVEGRKWSRVASLFGHAPEEEIYIVREDADGASYIQFGDGLTGARLPSGIKNVSIRYRSGNGANGVIKTGKTPLAGERFDGLDKVQLPGLVAGGAEPEDGDNAREAAPGKIQSLGRLVSLRDYETELLTIPGVVRSTAGWGFEDGVPTLTVRVLLEAGREAKFTAVKETIASYQRCRGPDRYPIRVEQAFLRYCYVAVTYAFDPVLLEADVKAAVENALGLAGVKETQRSGLFGPRRRRLGEKEYLTRIEGTVQQVSGVVWCQVSGLGMFAAGATDPSTLSVPAAPLPKPSTIVPAENQLLQLDAGHLVLTTAPAPPAEECA
jgi:predicted phage baseplate assembly protein